MAEPMPPEAPMTTAQAACGVWLVMGSINVALGTGTRPPCVAPVRADAPGLQNVTAVGGTVEGLVAARADVGPRT